jgi:GTP 3',8-cyclase
MVVSHLDLHSRTINYLRISITDRCNLRCVYCMPEEGVPQCAHANILKYEEIETVVRAAAELGIHKIRLTGGEPLVRLGVVDLVRKLAQVPGIDDLAMTTNGVLLPRYARELAGAGLQRVNISLDTLRADRFRAITRLGSIDDVLQGIEAATVAGLTPVKINMVVMRGSNDDEVVDMARQSMEPGWNVRFIEWMPVSGQDGKWRDAVVTGQEIRERIERTLGELAPARMATGAGPAEYYRLDGAKGTIGLITPVSDHFCHHCNRLRLTADGQLRPCLLSDQEIDLRTPLRNGAGVTDVKALLVTAIESKPLRHHISEHDTPHKRSMSQIGG